MREQRRVAIALVAIAVLAGCEETRVSQVITRVEADPLDIDFGVVDLTQDGAETITLRNLEAAPTRIRSIEIEDDCDGCFVSTDLQGELLGGFGELTLQARFRPNRIELATATLTVTLDEISDPTVSVTMRGSGRDGCAPDIAVVPEQVDFGFVPAGGVAVSSFVVRSTGTCDLLIDRVRVVPSNAPFRVTTSTPTPGQPGVLDMGGQASVGLRAELDATATGTTTASIEIETNVTFEKNVAGRPGVIQVPLSALANKPPIAVAGEDFTIEPWSRATLDGSASTDPDGSDDLLTYQWTLVNRPGGSTTVLERANTAQPSFWADLTGLYELELVVIDGLGLQSAPSRVVVEALPTNAVRIELTWDHPDSDLDLHLVRAGGAFCQCVEDVHYRDCGRAPNWFPEAPGANPRLDIDDRNGFGPENINLDGDGPDRFIPGGVYTIAVHYFASNADVSDWPTSVSNATVRVFVFGLLAAEFSRALEADGDLWTVGELRWPDQEVARLDGLAQQAICGVF